MTLPKSASLATQSGLPATGTRSTINGAHAEAARLDEQKWQAYVKEFAAPTIVRPALTTTAEASNIRSRSQTAAGALTILESRVADRLAWLSARDGFPTETPLDNAKAEAAAEFFARNGEKTLPGPAQAATPTSQPQPKPAPVPVTANPATLEIDYISAAGFPCKLTLSGTTGPAVLESARVAEERLLKFGAKPKAAPAHASAPTSGGAGESDVPMCAVHHKPMQKKTKDGRSWWSCNEKLTAEQAMLIGKEPGAWCQYRPPK